LGGLFESVGHGVSSAVGGAVNSIAGTLGSIVNQTSSVVPGGFPVVAIVTFVVAALIVSPFIRR